MKPRVKVAKGWEYRLILVDKDGVYAWDDYHFEEQARLGTHIIWRDYERAKLDSHLKEVK